MACSVETWMFYGYIGENFDQLWQHCSYCIHKLSAMWTISVLLSCLLIGGVEPNPGPGGK